MTMLDELGGRDAVEMVVAAFYDRVLADDRLKPHFRGVQMSRLQSHQVDFFCSVLGGGDVYRGRDMRRAHAHLQISDADFDVTAGHLVAALKACGVGQGHIDRILALVAPLREDIVTVKAKKPAGVSLRDEVLKPAAPARAPAAPARGFSWRWALVCLVVAVAAVAGVLLVRA